MSIRKAKKKLKKEIIKERKKCIDFLIQHPEAINPWMLTIMDSVIHTLSCKLQQLKRKKVC